MMAAAARMNHMIDALLSLSRLSTQPLASQPVDLSHWRNGWSTTCSGPHPSAR